MVKILDVVMICYINRIKVKHKHILISNLFFKCLNVMPEEEFLLPSALILLYSWHCSISHVFRFHKLYMHRKKEILAVT